MDKLKEILQELGLKFRFESAIVDVLDKMERRLYALEENRKYKDADILAMKKELGELRLIVSRMK